MHLATQELQIRTAVLFPHDDFYLQHLQQLRIITANVHQENMNKNALSYLASREIWEGFHNLFISWSRLYLLSFQVCLENLHGMKKMHDGFKQNMSLLFFPKSNLNYQMPSNQLKLNVAKPEFISVLHLCYFFSRIPQETELSCPSLDPVTGCCLQLRSLSWFLHIQLSVLHLLVCS